MTIALDFRAAQSPLIPALLLCGLSTVLAVESGVLTPPRLSPGASVALPTTVVVPARAFAFRAPGEFQRNGNPVSSPSHVVEQQAVEIMRFQVTAADYGRCVTAGACEPAHPRHRGVGDVPAAGVSFNDAQSYATWLSSQTGRRWRLPTVEEWDFAAGLMAADHGTQSPGSANDPSVLWLAQFDEQAKASARDGEAGLRPAGGFGSNQFGVSDMGGNVWEWTSSCNARTTLDDVANPISRIEVCGVRVLEGRHRMPMSAFVQDAKGGGCSMGIPPDNLGFRLVREPGPLERVTGWLQKMLGA